MNTPYPSKSSVEKPTLYVPGELLEASDNARAVLVFQRECGEERPAGEEMDVGHPTAEESECTRASERSRPRSAFAAR